MNAAARELRDSGPAELAAAAVLVTGIIAPAAIGFRAWVPALVLTVALAGALVLTRRRRPVLPWVFVAYLAVYAAAAAHGLAENFDALEASKYFAPPLVALAIATLADTPEARRRVLVLVLAVTLPQVAISAGQSIASIAKYGHADAIAGVDHITGSLGPDAPGTLTLVCMLGAVLAAAAALCGAWRRVPLLLAAGLLVLVGALTSTRAVYLFIPAAFVPLLAALWLYKAERSRRALLAYAAAVALAVPLSAGLMELLYPGSNASVQDREGLETYLDTNTLQPGQEPPPENGGDRTEVLPGRAEQVRIAARLSVEDGALTALLGRGLGATRFKSDVDAFEGSTRKPGLPENDVERTNGLWASRTLTEAGWLGIAAFAGLLAWLLVASRRLWAATDAGSWDRALALALPGVAGLTLAGAFYLTVLAVQPYASAFWVFTGVAVAAYAASARRSKLGVEP